MNINQLKEILDSYDGELPVCRVINDSMIELDTDSICVLTGRYLGINGDKLAYKIANDKFLLLEWIGNLEESIQEEYILNSENENEN